MKYSFVGRPDFNRIIDENPGADVLIVSREDGIVIFLFHADIVLLERLCEQYDIPVLLSYDWKNYDDLSGEMLLPGWVLGVVFSDDYWISALRKLAQTLVRVRSGKHTVEVLPSGKQEAK